MREGGSRSDTPLRAGGNIGPPPAREERTVRVRYPAPLPVRGRRAHGAPAQEGGDEGGAPARVGGNVMLPYIPCFAAVAHLSNSPRFNAVFVMRRKPLDAQLPPANVLRKDLLSTTPDHPAVAVTSISSALAHNFAAVRPLTLELFYLNCSCICLVVSTLLFEVESIELIHDQLKTITITADICLLQNNT